MTDSIAPQAAQPAGTPAPPPRTGKAAFLKDVLICSLGAYGGPEAHMGVFVNQLVTRRRYLSEDELIELLALCSILPGPTSTQVVVAIGYRVGGPLLALLSMLVWAVPVLLVMAALSFLYQFLSAQRIPHEVLRYIGPMAVGFIVVAALRIGRKVVTDVPTAALLGSGAVATYLIREPWIFPAVLVLGGAVSIVLAREPGLFHRARIHPPWRYLLAFGVLALGGLMAAWLSDNRLIQLFESFYRYGYLVFGGGQVVVPVMQSELVEVRGYLTNPEFLTGYGLVQGLPGPMFSFAAYAGGMATRDGSALRQVLGAMTSGVAIFLPGLLLIYFIYPIWEELKQIKGVRVSLRGINAVAGGLIAVAAVILFMASGLKWDNLAVTAVSAAVLLWGRIPAPLLVLAALVAGFLVPL